MAMPRPLEIAAPRITRLIIEQEMREALDDDARRNERTLSATIRIAIREYLARQRDRQHATVAR